MLTLHPDEQTALYRISCCVFLSQALYWDFPDWRRRIWPKDWRISHPLPAPDATRWGLVPLSLHQLTGTKATFSLREAHEVMQGLEDVQRARWRRRRADARELHTSRQTSPTPPPPPAPSPQRPAVPQARSNTPETAQREKPSPPPPPSGGAVPDAGTQRPAPQTASARPSAGHDGQPGGLAIPPLPRHPPFSPPPPLPAALPDGAEPGRRKGLRTVLRQLLRGKQE
ncbi:hypothetical protein ACH5AG_40845 [Streptomyces anulatus]